MILAAQLKKLIKENGVTVSALSRQTKIPIKTIYSWQSNQSPRNLDQVKLVALFFDVSLDYLLFGEEPTKKRSFEDFKDEINAGTFEVILRKINK